MMHKPGGHCRHSSAIEHFIGNEEALSLNLSGGLGATRNVALNEGSPRPHRRETVRRFRRWTSSPYLGM